MNNKFLFGDDGLNHIANRNNSNQLLVIQDRQVADSFVGHQRHAIIDSLIRADADYTGTHD